jgi:diguanylate cyclase (GGDEF)-like protein
MAGALLALSGPASSLAHRKLADVPALSTQETAPKSRIPATGQTARTQPGHLPTLTTALEVHSLLPSQSARQYPVHLRAVCVVCFAGWHGFFVHDGATGIFVETKDQVPLTAAIHPGTLLEIDGVTGQGEYAPIVDRSSLRIIGTRPIPHPRLVSVDHLSTGAEDGQWIAFEGTVRSTARRDSMLELVVASGRLRTEVMTPLGGKDFERLVNARVRVNGTAGPIFNQRRQLIGTNVYSPSLDNIHVIEPAPSDPFSVPLRQVSSVFEYSPGAGPDHMVRVHGVVAARWGQTVFINDGNQGASVLSREVTTLGPGDVVDAVGYPVLGDSAHTIDDAVFRRLGTAPMPEPRPATVKQALSGDYEGDLIRLDGRLLELRKGADQTTLLVDAGGAVFSAVLPGELKEQALTGFEDGSQIRLTGICVISETQASRHFRLPKAFQILLRSPEDVAVLERPSWWTPGHALIMLALAMMCTFVVLGWVVALRKRVEQQTSLLRESEERFRHMAQHDSLTGLATRVVLHDRLNVALENAKRHQAGLALLMLDLDRFKEINDSLGHHVGDEVLRVTAGRIAGAVRKSDTIARMGGDEFVVLLPDLDDPAFAEEIAAKVVAALSIPIACAGIQVPISVSVGVCTASAGELDAEALLKNVDAALYRAKAQGRNCFQIFRLELARAQ